MSTEITALATILSSLIEKRLSLGSQYSVPVHVLIMATLGWLSKVLVLDSLYSVATDMKFPLYFLDWIWVAVGSCVCLFVVYKFWSRSLILSTHLRLMVPKDQKAFMKYMLKTGSCVSLSMTSDETGMTPSFDVKHEFCDKKYNVVGHFLRQREKMQIEKRKVVDQKEQKEEKTTETIDIEILTITVKGQSAYSYYLKVKKAHRGYWFKESVLILNETQDICTFLSYVATLAPNVTHASSTEFGVVEKTRETSAG